MDFNHYQVLGIRRNASHEEIKKAYKSLAKKYHPDVNPGNSFYEEHFKKINEAQEVLLDKTKRDLYDIKLYQLENPYVNYNTTSSQTQYKTKRKQSAPSSQKRQYYSLNITKKQGLAILSFFAFMSIVGYFLFHFMNTYTSNQHYEMGLQCEQRKDYEGASYYYHQALEMDKNNFKVHKQLAYCLINHSADYKESFIEASYLLNYLINNSDENTDSLRYSLSKCYISLNKYKEALIELKKINQNFNDSILLFKGECYLQENDWTNALNVFESYLVKNPKSDLCLQKIAYTHYKNIEYEKAKVFITQAMIIDPANGGHFFIRGLIAIGELDTLSACHYFHSSYDLEYELSDRAINKYCR